MAANREVIANRSRIAVTPTSAMIDERVAIRLAGFAPQRRVTVRAQMHDDADQLWQSAATFETDGDGAVDLARQPPIGGSYTTTDAMGLFWSMTTDGPAPCIVSSPALTVAFTAEVAGESVASTTHERRLIAPGVTETIVEEDGLVGRFFRPAGDGPFPAVMVLGGSGGGFTASRNIAALLAPHGYAALALAYFGIPPLPTGLRAIPLEYFASAIAWLHRQSSVRGGRLAVCGASRGGELALLLGATFRQVTAVIGLVPSGVLTNAVLPGGGMFGDATPEPSWTLGGEPLPFLRQRVSDTQRRAILEREPVSLTPLFQINLEDAAAVEEATIPVERINGPVLLLSSGDDQMWPSPEMAEIAERRLAAHHHPYVHTHIRYPGAGHQFGYPYLPTTSIGARHAVSGRFNAWGGNGPDQAEAARDAWGRILQFLSEHFR